MKLFDDVRRAVWFDAALFHGRRKLAVAMAGAALVPALYTAIYLLSAWDPYGHLDALPVALVELDRGAEVHGQHVVVGDKIVAKLRAARTFAWREVATEEEARALVTHGDAVFAVIVPVDFSENAVPGVHAKPGRVRIAFSEGNNFMAATIARRFAGEMAHGANEALNEERWSVVLDTVDRSRTGLQQLRAGVAQLVDGSQQLSDGASQLHGGASQLREGAGAAHAGSVQLSDGAAKLSTGVGALTDGVAKLGDGLRTLDDKLPSRDVLAQLKDGAHQVAVGNDTLASGVAQLDVGARKAKDGAKQLREGTAKIPVVGGKISDGALRIEDGLAKLGGGLDLAQGGADKLKTGAKKLDDGVAKLTDGVGLAHDGVHTMVTKLPAPDQLAQLKDGAGAVSDGAAKLSDGLAKIDDGSAKLDDGSAKLADGAARLHDGLALLQSSLPGAPGPNGANGANGANGDVGADLTGDAAGLAASVTPDLVALTSVGPYGNSMAPYFIGLSLWVGVVMAGFILRMRWWPARLRTCSRVSLAVARMAIPLPMVLTQATLLVLTMRFVVGVPIANVPALWLLCAVTSTTFLAILEMLIAIFGDVGKAIALLLLVFQMSASAGVFPVELTAGVFRFVHPYLPFSWVVQAARALLFGAFDGAWPSALLRVAWFGVAALALTSLCARWKWVARHEYAPLLDV